MSLPYRFLALGDSYTIGEGVPPATRWPCVVAARLRARGLALDDPRIVAVTGWSTDELAAGIEAAAPRPPWDLVTLLIGVNNQYRGRDLDNYDDEFGTLLQRAVGLAGGRANRVVGVSIPDWGVTRFARVEERDGARIGADLDAFNAAAQARVRSAGARWADVTPVSRHCGEAPDMLADDGLHPSAAQYAVWADVIAPVAEAALRDGQEHAIGTDDGKRRAGP